MTIIAVKGRPKAKPQAQQAAGRTLYEIAGEYRDAAAVLADSDMPEEVITDTLEGIKGEAEDKLQSLAAVILNLEAEADAVKAAADKMTARYRALNTRAESLREYALQNMKAVDLTEVRTSQFVLKVALNNPAVIVDNENDIPESFFITMPATSKLDKTAVADAIKSGVEVPGAHLERKSRLSIK
jgi:hypothetical protein